MSHDGVIVACDQHRTGRHWQLVCSCGLIGQCWPERSTAESMIKGHEAATAEYPDAPPPYAGADNNYSVKLESE